MNFWLEQYQQLLSDKSIWSWLAVGVLSLILTFLVKLVLVIFSSRMRKFTAKTVSIWDDVGLDIVDGLKAPVTFAWIFYLLTKALSPTDFQRRLLLIAVVVCSIFQVGIWGLYLIRNWRKVVLEKRIAEDPSSSAALGLLYTAVQTAFLTIIILIGLSNLGVNISALIAGLGVGGIAVALAAQNVLGDLLASLSIVLDKPFVVGDFIIAGNELGTVENIGVKTTRLRSLSGEELVLSNKDLLESRIRNYKRMWERRVVQNFGVLYSTSAETLEQIPDWVKGFIQKHPKLRFDRCHLAKYGASSLDYEFVFYVLDPDYNVYMDLQQKVLLDIFRKFNEAGVGFAFPSRSVYVESMPEKNQASKD